MNYLTNAAKLEMLKGRLVVSCQAYPGEPMRHSDTMTRVARACLMGGAAGIRAQGLSDLNAIRKITDNPIIGLVKSGNRGVFITPTLELALAVTQTGADIVAIDGTTRPRPDGLSLTEVVTRLHADTSAMVMADISTLEEALNAVDAGVDVIGTTLAGYTPYSNKTDGPDLELLSAIKNSTGTPVVAEGRIHTPEQAANALQLGAHSVVVGTAITHPSTITSWFVNALPNHR
ncbi:N-acetylmannosamine-6-phosphate 2-epimerase [Nakamurella sp. A5-74]|uniref:Putative N-acetylmannosamine-6-phosphate 2-epimerase n=1 Tax=Nakamurella sp. A5-74 TaxID=3158264 RepID=A0AAU8DNK9_9ACTN